MLGDASCDVGCMVCMDDFWWFCNGQTKLTCLLIARPCMVVHVAFFLGVLETYGAWWLLHVANIWSLVACLEDALLWRSVGHLGGGVEP